MQDLKEMSQFLVPNARADVKIITLQYILGLTGNVDGIKYISECKEVLKRVVALTSDKGAVKKDALLILVNVSAEEVGADALMKFDIDKYTFGEEHDKTFLKSLTEMIIDENDKDSDAACMILCNVSRREVYLEHCADALYPYLGRILNAFTNLNFNKAGAKLHYLGPLFSNLSGSVRVCNWLSNDQESKRGTTRIASFSQFNGSLVRRGGAVGTLRNLCFIVELHDKLLGPEVDILTYLLLPLAGGEEYPDDEMNALPISLQYLPNDKQRESDPDIRRLLLESLNKLCIKKSGREFLRDSGTYYILRELHKWEDDRKALLACENVVDILIKKEDEIEVDDISSVNVPEEYHEKFHKMDDDFVNDV